jgi:hypothetical protein
MFNSVCAIWTVKRPSHAGVPPGSVLYRSHCQRGYGLAAAAPAGLGGLCRGGPACTRPVDSPIPR